MKFLPKKIRVGVDLGSTNIKIIGVQQHHHKYELLFHEVVDLINQGPLEAYEEITDELYVQQLSQLVEKYELANSFVAATIPSSSAILRGITVVAPESEEELSELVQDELRQTCNANFDEMQIACEVLENDKINDEHTTLFACAVPDVVVKRVEKILSRAGLKPTVLDPDALEIYNAFEHLCSDAISEPTAIVQIGSQYTICVITQPGKDPFFHIINLGGNDITKHIMEDLNITYNKAETLKRKMYQKKWANKKSYQDSKLPVIFAEYCTLLIAEVKKCIRYFQTNEGVAQIEKILLTGGGAQLYLLADTFQRHLSINTELWYPINQLEQPHAHEQEAEEQEENADGLYFTPCIGAIIRGQ